MNSSPLFRLLLIALAGVLAGCGGVRYTSSYPPPPEHFSHHSVGQDRFFDLHWTLERREGQVEVEGIVTASRVGGIAEVTLEVVGLDEGGRVLSRAHGVTYGGPMIIQGQSRPFWKIRLRPTGRETEFQVRVWSFNWYFGGGEMGLLRSRPSGGGHRVP